jgi:iron complex outermembrane receptor protein
MKKLPVARATCLLVASAFSAAPTLAAMRPVAEIADLSLEQLTQITVTSASRREERLLEAPASIFVITAEDIRRSGATTLPEALRIAPNLQVVRGDTSQYVVSARGGLGGTANKMLVLIDGRTVYTPLFAGVFWDAQNVLLEDVERIEVISGPGGTLWGTNAVNGVVNITTKPASKTPGVLAFGGAGSQERGAGGRIGGALPGGGAYRAYVKYFDRDAYSLEGGASALDQADRWQAGFRTDWERAERTLTLQGDAYSASVGNLAGDRPLSGANVLVRMRQQRGPDSDLLVQAYYDRTEREHVGSFKERRDTVDVEAQVSSKPWTSHHLVWGGNYRASHDRTEDRPALSFLPASRTLSLASLYVQDDVDLGGGLSATAGVRAERNSYTGLEWLPNLRLTFAATPDNVLWGAISRAVRAPSRIDRDVFVPGAAPYLLVANDAYRSEVADVAELGYRVRLARGVSLSLTAFHHRFRDLRTVETGSAPLVFGNGARATTRGLEGWADFLVTRDWRLVGGFALLSESASFDPGSVPETALPGNDPRRTASLRSLWNVTRRHELDLTARYVGRLSDPEVPAYSTLDARFGWRLSRNLELSLLVSNVFDRRHAEFGPPAIRAVFERTFFVKATWML